MQKYLTVGPEQILSEYMREIINPIDPNDVKPLGGLWLTEHFIDNPFNDWVDFLISHPGILWRKQVFENNNVFDHVGCVVELKNTASILYVKSLEEFRKLGKEYRTQDIINYEQISQDYEGLFLDFSELKGTSSGAKTISQKFAVNTLILFSLEAISKYYKAQIKIEPFNLECPPDYYDIDYKITVEEKEHYIKPVSQRYIDLYRLILTNLKEQIASIKINGGVIEQIRAISNIKNIIDSYFSQEIKDFAEKENLDYQKLILTFSSNVYKNSA